MRRDPVVNDTRVAARCRGRGAPPQHLPALVLRHVVELGQPTVRVPGERLHRPHEARRDPLHHRGIEARGRVLEVTRHGPAGVDELDRDVERRGPGVDRDRLDDGARQVELVERAVVQRERRLEQRVDAEQALGRYPRDHLIERHVEALEGAEERVLDAAAELDRREVAVDADPERHHVHEVADGVLDGRMVPAGQRGADDDVALAAVPGKHDREGPEQQGEPGQPRRRRGGPELGAQGRAEVERDAGAAMVRLRRRRYEGGEGDLGRRARQGLRPRLEHRRVALGCGAARQPAVVLDRTHAHRRQSGGGAAGPRPVGGGEVAGDDGAGGPPVGHGVMHRPREHRVVRAEPPDREPQGRLVGEPERPCGLRPDQCADLFHRTSAGVVPRHHDRALAGPEQLPHRLAVQVDLPGPQRLVPLDQIGHRRVERILVEVAADANRGRHVVDPDIGEALEETQRRHRPRDRRLRGRLRLLLRLLRRLLWRLLWRRRRRGPGGPPDRRREPLDGRVVEERADRDLEVVVAAHPRQHLHGEQRVPAKLEEVRVRPGHLAPEDLRPRGEQLALQGVGPGRGAGGRLRVLRDRGQGVDVDLAGRGRREDVEDREQARHHLAREALPRDRRELGDGRPRPVRGRHHVGRQMLVGAPVHGGHDRPPDGRVRHQRSFDLAGLDADAADLELPVDPSEVLERAVRAVTYPVAGAVHPRPRFRRPRVGREPFGGQLVHPEVAAGHAGAADGQLARHADRHRTARPVQDVDVRVRRRAADAGVRLVVVRYADPERALDRGLGRSVVVLQAAVGEPREARALQGARQRLAAADEHPQRRAATRPVDVLEQDRELRWDDLHHVHAEPVDEIGDLGRVPREVGLAAEDHPPAVGQRPEQLPRDDVERHGGGLQGRARGAERQVRRPGMHLVDEVAVLEQDRLRPAGRPGREDVVAGVTGNAPRHRAARVRPICERRARECFNVGDRPRPVRHRRPGLRGREHPPARRLLEDETEPVRRVSRVKQDEAPARLQHRERGDHQVGYASHADRHRGPGRQAVREQTLRDAVAAPLELGVGDGFAWRHDRGRLAAQIDLPLDDRRDQLVRVLLARPVPAVQDALELVRGQQVEAGDRPVRRGDGGPREHPKVGGPALDRTCVEHFRVVPEHEPVRLRADDEVDARQLRRARRQAAEDDTHRDAGNQPGHVRAAVALGPARAGKSGGERGAG